MKYESERCQLRSECVVGRIEGLQARYLVGMHGSEDEGKLILRNVVNSLPQARSSITECQNNKYLHCDILMSREIKISFTVSFTESDPKLYSILLQFHPKSLMSLYSHTCTSNLQVTADLITRINRVLV